MNRWAWLIPVTLAVMIYLPTCRGQYVWDDGIVIDRQILAFKNIGDLLFPPDHIPQWGQNYYRPVIVMTYLLDHWLFGPQDPTGRHLTNIVLHGMVTILVWIFVLQCLKRFPHREWGAAVAACLFAVHPIHTESVSWITGRSDTVAALFMMASVVTVMHYVNRKTPWVLLLAPVLYFLALLSKEVALSTILILPFIVFLTPVSPGLHQESDSGEKPKTKSSKKKVATTKRQPPWNRVEKAGTERVRRALVLFAPFLLATAVYFVIRHRAMVGHGTSLGLGLDEIIFRGWRATAYYVLKAIFPPPQLHFVSLKGLPSLWWSAIIIVALAAACIFIVRKWKYLGPLFLFSLAWFGCTLAPSLPVAISKISEAPVAERYLFLPSVGLALLLGGLFCITWEKVSSKKWLVSCTCLVICLYGGMTVHRNLVWLDNVRLWRDAVTKAPDQGLPWTELGMAYLTKNDVENALASFQRAVAADYDSEGRSIAYSNMGMIFLRQGDTEKAEIHFRNAIRERENYPTPHYGLGLTGLERTKKGGMSAVDRKVLDESIRAFKKAVELDPNYVKALWGLTSAYAILADMEKQVGNRKATIHNYQLSIQTYESLTQVDPHFPSEHPQKAQWIQRLRDELKSISD